MEEYNNKNFQHFQENPEMKNWKNIIQDFTSANVYDAKIQFAFGQFGLRIQQAILNYDEFNLSEKNGVKEWITESLNLLKNKMPEVDKVFQNQKNNALMEPLPSNFCQSLEEEAIQKGIL